MTNKEYIKARNKLIPLAVAYANKKEGKTHQLWEGLHKFERRWNVTYLTEMDRLAKESGISVTLTIAPKG